MKKINFLVISLLLLVFTSCKDDSGEYERTYHTDTQLAEAIKLCLEISVDTANSHLAVEDGFYAYNDAMYRIALPASANVLVEVLEDNDEVELLDTLILRMNKAAEISGDYIRNNFRSVIAASTFPDPDKLLRDSIPSLTNYLRDTKTFVLTNALNNAVGNNLSRTGAITAWNEAMEIYQQHATQVLSIDFTENVTRQLVDGIMKEMAIEEEFIRTDTTHQHTTFLKEVFRNY
ncbi:DUF4197 domain-containing protein [Bacteroidales bacterium OttesenSCG-928-B11]|nr:DUF4197 domain-containing protein [Bacteroidales bacterium OttesenSCG-928-E04]MDL2312907.1 DUF4197 domain-containing protein [Bacteroidales bacterium OttesenSCG-928-B11]MDL2326391.1 DUF4197 domain-containing protein [Bacteroidales bacterium OttesenSCG-928-A14]